MKVKLNGLKGAPHEVARLSGGVTFEPETGWWTQSDDSKVHQLGEAFADERDAAYIPTLQKTRQARTFIFPPSLMATLKLLL